MAPPPWATSEQTAWLKSWLKDYITRQAESKLHLFWPAMVEAWFRQYPEHPGLGLPMPNDPSARVLTEDELALLGVAITARRKQLVNWFRNHRAKVSNVSPPATSTAIRKLFNVEPTKRQRAHKPVELFQKRNKERIDVELEREGYNGLKMGKAPEEEDDWEDEAEDTPEGRVKRTKSERMRMRTRVVKALFAEAAQEELDEIDGEIAKEKEVLRAEEVARESLDSSIPKSRSPAELQGGIDHLDSVFRELHHATWNTAGWVGMTILGGPNPRLDGELSVKIICSGETAAGNDFEDVCVDFDKNVTQPFEAYLRAVFTAQECKARAMPTRSEPAAPEGRIARDDAPAAALPTKSKKPKRMSKAKKDKARKTKMDETIDELDADIVSETGSVDDSGSFPEEADFGGFPDPSVLPSDDRHEDNDPMPDTLASPSDGPRDDDDPFGDAQAEGFTPWPPGMSLPSSPATAAAAAMRERGGMAGGATMAIDPQLLSPTTPTPRPPPRPSYRGTAAYAESRAAVSGMAPAVIATRNIGGFNFPLVEAQTAGTTPTATPTAMATGDYRPSTLFGAFRSGGKSTPAPANKTTSQRPVPSAFTTPGFASMTARAMAGLVGAAPTASAPVGPKQAAPKAPPPPTPKPAVAIVAPAPKAMAPKPAAIAAGSPPPPPPPPTATDSGAEGDGPAAADDAVAVAVAVAARILPQSRPPAKAPGPKAEEGGGGGGGWGREEGRPKKKVVEEEEEEEEEAAPLANTTNSGEPAAGRGQRKWRFSAAAEIQRFHELNKSANAIEAAAAANAAGGIIRLPNPAGPTDIIVLTRTRKPAKRADGSEVQLPVKGKRPPANPHAASEAAMLARSATTKAGATGSTKRKVTGGENVTAPKAKRART
ncbi:hypothetical protein FB451DRAFT_1566645 [Mycena latifolia]|nr:hypothetical protein FB451DRAFT_1566645 [Mycena latifolia]